jgi:hypothetical protein
MHKKVGLFENKQCILLIKSCSDKFSCLIKCNNYYVTLTYLLNFENNSSI